MSANAAQMELNSAMADLDQFAICFAQAVTRWNEIELQTKRLLVSMAAGNATSFIAIHKLSAVQLYETLHVASRFLPNANERDHVAHAANLFDRIRHYRNHYVHGVFSLSVSSTQPVALGRVWSVQTRRAVQVVEEDVSLQSIQAFFGYTCELWSYLEGVLAAHESRQSKRSEPEPWPTKPKVFPALMRNKRTIIAPENVAQT